MAIGRHCQIVTVMVSAEYAAGWAAVGACQGVPQLLGHQRSGVDCGSARHMLRLAEAGIEERAGVGQVCSLVVGIVVVASGLGAAHIGAVRHLVVVGSAVAAVADAPVGSLEVAGRTGLLAEAQSTAVGLAVVVVGLSRVRPRVCIVGMS
jgi:hypothetical protein